MQPAVLIKLLPSGPWRSGPADGGRDHAEPVFGSDRLFSAVSLAMRQLGFFDEWLDATARRTESPAVAFTSVFPFSSDGLFAPPPATLWPPPPAQVTAPSPVFLTKMRWKAARFVPMTLVESMLLGQTILADQWLPDPQTGCLLRRDRPSVSPFRLTTRTAVAVDRPTQSSVHVHATACIEFEPGAGLWTVARFADRPAEEQWSDRIKASFGLLADTGFGGRRSSGWGQTKMPELQSGTWPGVLMPKLARRLQAGAGEPTTDYWLLSLYSPSSTDNIDWKGGDYSLSARGGFVHSNGQSKKTVRMVTEGSVLSASQDPSGLAVDVAPEGAPHPVYRAGFALTLRLPVIELAPSRKEAAVEQPSDPDALEPAPCEAAAEPETPTEPEPQQTAMPEEPPPTTGEEPGPPEQTIESSPHSEPTDSPEPEPAMPTTGEPEAGLGIEPEHEPEPEHHPEVPPDTAASGERAAPEEPKEGTDEI